MTERSVIMADIDIEAKNVSAKISELVYGVPSPFSNLGFLRAMFFKGRRFESIDDFFSLPFMHILKDYSFKADSRWNSLYFFHLAKSADRTGEVLGTTIFDTPTIASIKTSLIVNFGNAKEMFTSNSHALKMLGFISDSESKEEVFRLLSESPQKEMKNGDKVLCRYIEMPDVQRFAENKMRYVGGQLSKAEVKLLIFTPDDKKTADEKVHDYISSRKSGLISGTYDIHTTLESAYADLSNPRRRMQKFLTVCGYKGIGKPSHDSRFSRMGLPVQAAESIHRVHHYVSVKNRKLFTKDNWKEHFYREKRGENFALLETEFRGKLHETIKETENNQTERTENE